MSKVASLTISAKSRGRLSSDGSPTSPTNSKLEAEDDISEGNQNAFHLNDEVNGSSGSEDDKNLRGRGSSSGSSPERKSLSQRKYETYDSERGLIHSGRSGKMSSRQRSLERELETENPNMVASMDDALASSDDGLEDNFIPRKSKDKYYMIKSGSDSDQGGSIYEKKNIEPPRKKSEGAGNRVRSRTGELFSNYERDHSFDGLSEEEKGIEKPKTSVSILKAAYSKKTIDSKTVDRYKVDEELEQIRYTMQNRGMMEENGSDDDRGQSEGTQDVMYRKSLSSIKDRFFAAASGRKVRSSSDSEEDAEDGDTKEEVVAPPQRVVDMKDQWQSRKSWHEQNKDLEADIVSPPQGVIHMKTQWQQGNILRIENKAHEEDIVSPLQRVVDMTRQWQKGRPWQSRRSNVDVVSPSLRVVEMRSQWQRRSLSLDYTKSSGEDIVPPSQRVIEMRNQWPQKWMSFDKSREYREEEEEVVSPPQRVADMKAQWPQERDSWRNEKARDEVLAPPQPVLDMKEKWQQGKSWVEENKSIHEVGKVLRDVDAQEDIDVSQVGSARSAFKELESRQETVSTVNRPRGNKIADPQQIMGERRQKTYGDGEQVDGIIKHEGQDELSTVEIDIAQIKEAKQSFKKLESSRYQEQPNLRKPSMKIIKQEDVRKTMDDHRRKVSAEDFDDYTDHIKHNGSIAMTVTPTITNGDTEHLEEY